MKLSRAKEKQIYALRLKKRRREAGFFLVEGVRACEEAVSAGCEVEAAVRCVETLSSERGRELADRLLEAGVAVYDADEAQFARLSQTENPQGLLLVVRHAVPPLDALKFSGDAVILALDGVADPGNAGTLLRTADWLGVEAVLLGPDCVELHNPKVVRATMGSLFRVPAYELHDLGAVLDVLKSRGFTIFASAVDGDADWQAWVKPRRRVLVLGSEPRGISRPIRERADALIAVPRLGGGESLNVAVAAGILLHAALPPTTG